jgi:hypothetical protein
VAETHHAGRPIPLRGDIDVAQCMETLQEGYLHAVCAAARCDLAKPNRDRGIDWKVSHQSELHTHDFAAELRVQLKATYHDRKQEARSLSAFARDRVNHSRGDACPPGG